MRKRSTKTADYNSLLNSLQFFERAPDTTLFEEDMVANIRGCCLSTLHQDRMKGKGVPYTKIGRLVRYRKSDILQWLNSHPSSATKTGN